MTDTLYLDANATTQVMPVAAAAALRVMSSQFGNPSSTHCDGLVAQAVLSQARAHAQQALGAGSGHLMFTSGATEGIQTAVLSALCAIRAQRRRGEPGGRLLMVGATEHKAVPQSLAHWNTLLELDLEICTLPVNAQGAHDLDFLAKHLPDVALLCTMAANNETGVVTRLSEIEQLLQATASPALWLVDSVQALGKLPLNLQATRIDYAPFSGHKLYAPKGVGLLYVREGAPFTPLMTGGGQEQGLRSGTENMAGIAALGAVLEALNQNHTFASLATLRGYQSRLAHSLQQAFPGLVFNVAPEACLPTTLNFSVPGVSSKQLLDLFDAASLRVSAGSACNASSAAQAAPSFVLEAMGLPEAQTRSAVRLSFGPLTPPALVDQACAAIARCGQVLGHSPEAEAQPPTAAPTALLPALDWAALEADCTLSWAALANFLHQHPAAQLVDVREAFEHAASSDLPNVQSIVPMNVAVNVPLSRLGDWVPQWLQSGAPLVFFCRSGHRSQKAVEHLLAHGHTQVRHLQGGLAFQPRRQHDALA
jgi:cysteine sulfinate desulfinase/cysteine desulfurase-like protein/rhodanese-related sulfurtransferase